MPQVKTKEQIEAMKEAHKKEITLTQSEREWREKKSKYGYGVPNPEMQVQPVVESPTDLPKGVEEWVGNKSEAGSASVPESKMP